MPRISRFIVEFTISSDSKTWMAEFVHQHAREVCPHRRADGTPEHTRLECSHHDDKGRKQHQPHLCPAVRTSRFCPAPIVEGITYRVDHGKDAGKFVKLRHLTLVKLRHKGSSIFLSGHAPCSIKDEYNWRKGLHYALQRAMEKAGYCKLEKQGNRIVITNRKPIYDEICEAFWREMRIPAQKAPQGSRELAEPQPRALLAAPMMHGMGYSEGPPTNPWGTYYAGAD